VAADSTVVIYCSDIHLVRETVPSAWKDVSLLAEVPTKWGDQTACQAMAGLTGYTYLSELTYGPHSAIVLCTGHNGALDPSKKEDGLQTIGEKWRTWDWNGVDFDSLKWFTSETILHESMHTKPIEMGTNLPDDLGPEKYFVADIMALPVNVRSLCPESWATIASALYMANNAWTENVEGGTIPRFGDELHYSERPTGSDISMHANLPTT
jgi:hypothetical protein